MTGSHKKGARTRPTKSDAYLKLVQRFPLKHLRSDRELAAAIEMLKSLLMRGDLAPGEQDYLDVLTDIVERYEDVTHPMPEVSDAAMLRHLIDASGVTQSKLAAEVGIAMSTILSPWPIDCPRDWTSRVNRPVGPNEEAAVR
jgi:antitoxin component HigA of HigAB toxin-antitoxin module